MSRRITKRIKILVEGKTEENYFKGFKEQPELKLYIKTVNMNGGGYSNFLKQLKKEDETGFLAIFIIIDLDKALIEKKALEELIKYCDAKNKHSIVPYFLIGNNKDFEFFVCCHCPNYKNNDTHHYITKHFGYKSLEELKADNKIFDFLNKNRRSYKNTIQKLKQNQPHYFSHQYSVRKEGVDISILLRPKKTTITDNSLNYNHSNIYELFDILLEL